MHWHPLINVQIQHDFFDVLSLVLNIILGTAAIASLWISRTALKKSEWDSSMSTSPSLIVRPTGSWVGVRRPPNKDGYSVMMSKDILIEKSDISMIAVSLTFECFNAGRGPAFNLSDPIATGMPFTESEYTPTPIYLTKEDGSFEIKLLLEKSFDEFFNIAKEPISVSVRMLYTNDQNSVYCRSTWSADVQALESEGEGLKPVITLSKISSRVDYSDKPYE